MKKEYSKPSVFTVNIQHKTSILVGTTVTNVVSPGTDIIISTTGGDGTAANGGAPRVKEINIWDEEW